MHEALTKEAVMDTNAFISLHEAAKTRHPIELKAISYPNPMLAHYTFFSVMEGLRKDWRDLGKDPGKHKPHRFWVRSVVRNPEPHDSGDVILRCDRFWPREVLDDVREAERGYSINARDAHVVGLPVPLGTLDDCLSQACPSCGKAGPVIGTYMQTRNSFEYDEWQFSLAVLCTRCASARPFHRQSECRRFAHEIFRTA